ncbi:hypothetical protein GGF46_001439 [Coemansia sp. RSA 552]|nr:hypothetical protein GGF46_001439 [Coemansia sp. RSA 552]
MAASARGDESDLVRLARKTFEEAYKAPTLTGASARRCGSPGIVSIEYTASQRDLERNTKRTIVNHMTLDIRGATASVLARGTPVDISGVSLSQPSPAEPSLVAVLRMPSAKVRVVEIWRDGVLEKSTDVSATHGDFYGDSTFGGLAWSEDSRTVVYAAERPERDKEAAELYDFDGDWGETFSGKRPPVLVVVDVVAGSAEALPSIEGISPGQVQYVCGGPAHGRLVFTGYKHDVRKHGIVYCQNRPTGIYTCNTDGSDIQCIYSGSVRSPRITPSGRGVVFLSTMLGGPHASTSAIVHYSFEEATATTLVPVINRPLQNRTSIDGTQLPEGFVGVYADQLPAHPWIRLEQQPEKEVLAFTSTWRTSSTVLTLDIQQRVLARQTPVDGSSSNVVLGAAGDLLLGKSSTPSQPDALLVGEASCNPDSQDVVISWHNMAQPEAMDNMAWKVLRSGKNIENILVYPPTRDCRAHQFWPDDNAASRPLVVQPHGGPHSTYTVSYNPLVAGLTRLGFGVLLVNFTGSLGFGQEAVLAQVGVMDTVSLDEIQQSASQVHARGEGDKEATVYLGGSYSGYTGALLAGKAPGFYRGIALRNPVISVGENAAMTDIPDWCWAELGLEYSFESPPELTPEVFAQMWQASASRLAAKVKDPLLLLLGAADRRVPPAQSLSFYYRLKAAGAPVQCKVYPGAGHPLDTIEAERDSFMSLARFYAAALTDN